MSEQIALFNDGLSDLREMFHRKGRLEDSTAKLDELVRLLCVDLASIDTNGQSIPSLGNLLDSKTPIVPRINAALKKAAALEQFTNFDGESLLGRNPELALAAADDALARKMAELVRDTFETHLRNPESAATFEMLNEAFGHFVRDNFRNNIEDAQYMTPPEVVDFMCQLGANLLSLEEDSSKRESFTVCDPSCGVGSFLAQFNRVRRETRRLSKKPVQLVGQDKVDRMARMTRINLRLFGFKDAHISRGNSLQPGSPLDQWHGRCDLILTNPPFGARFPADELAPHACALFPNLARWIASSTSSIDSELLFLDRYTQLLRPGGYALAVLPDSSISGAGIAAALRSNLRQTLTVHSVIELPPVTFAQAGTRTKTCILCFQKKAPSSGERVLFARSEDLGFEVSSRKGVPYKVPGGKNDLPQILDAFRSCSAVKRVGTVEIYSFNPSVVSTDDRALDQESWTPNHHSASRYDTLSALQSAGARAEYNLVKLRDMVTVGPERRRGIKPHRDAKCISVLHIGDFGSINIREFMNYEPKYPGQPCNAGDVLFSKINPRIPRAFVVPDFGFPLSCSTEFEVLVPRAPYTAYQIMLLLLSGEAQTQIAALTSGTSSSHNRIKSHQLLDVAVRIPKPSSKTFRAFSQTVDKFESAHRQMVDATRGLWEAWSAVSVPRP